MSILRVRPLLLALCLTLLSASAACASMLPDSTMLDGWRLANGLEVRARHILGAKGIAITVAYRAGSLQEPAGREGLAELLGELEFTSAAGEIPSRTREELPSIRPLGAALKVNEQLAMITEIAAPGQLPGVLHQVAIRMRGVTVTEPELRATIAAVKRRLGDRRFGRADLALYYRVRDLAMGLSDDQVLRLANGRGIEAVTLKEAQSQLATLYVPSNAVLSIAGDLSNVDVRKLVEAEFAGIPGGTARADAPEPVLRPALRTVPWNDTKTKLNVLGVITPAVSDSLHPSFYLAALIAGPWVRDKIGDPEPPLTTRFQFSLLDEPDFVRFYLPTTSDTTSPGGVSADLFYNMDELANTMVDKPTLDAVRFSVLWLLGGPITPPVMHEIQRSPAPLGTLSTSMATRALWRGDAFWDLYRQRLERTTFGHSSFTAWLADRAHHVVLQFAPGSAGK